MTFYLHTLSWAIIFIIQTRFLPGKSLVNMFFKCLKLVREHSSRIIELGCFLTDKCVLKFPGDGKKLADIGLDDDHCICIWDWKKAEKLATTRGHKDKIYVLEWNPFNNNYFVTVGEKHIKFWTHNGET